MFCSLSPDVELEKSEEDEEPHDHLKEEVIYRFEVEEKGDESEAVFEKVENETEVSIIKGYKAENDTENNVELEKTESCDHNVEDRQTEAVSTGDRGQNLNLVKIVGEDKIESMKVKSNELIIKLNQ